MGHFLSVVLHTIRRKLFLFIFIVFVLSAGKLVRNEWANVANIVNELPALQSAQAGVREHQGQAAQGISQQVTRLSGASMQQLDAHIGTLDNDIRLLQREQDAVSLSPEALIGGGGMVDMLRQKAVRGVDIELRRQARAHLVTVRQHLIVAGNRQMAEKKLEQLQAAHVRAFATLQGTQRRLARTQAAAGMLARIPFTTWHRQVQKLNSDVRSLTAANNRAYQEYLAQRTVLARLSLPTALSQFKVDDVRLAMAASPLRDRVLQAERLAAKNYLWQAYQAVRPVLPTALAVLMGWWLVPAAIRTFFYYVLAPQAARLPPIVISPINTTGTGAGAIAPSSQQRSARDGSVISAVSQTFRLTADQEMLIRPDYCQSQPAGVDVTTKILFNWHNWLTSIAAQLWMLKRLRTALPADIVVSSTADALDEVALLVIAPGQAMVLQPRGLVGMMYQTGQRPTIRSHWRLGTLHAWLTLQLRYLAFEGPATLIVKGCRGVRLENALSGRTISQDATLGFSANARYATVRAEPFIPYLRGKQPLFHDTFSGPDACCLYEEVPRTTRPNGGKQNPLEALLNASLKAFGI